MLAQALRKHKIPFDWWVKILSTNGAIRAIEEEGVLDAVIAVSCTFTEIPMHDVQRCPRVRVLPR